ncbi:MAG: serine/threonine-protein kinase [Sumerlaeia bacterium]
MKSNDAPVAPPELAGYSIVRLAGTGGMGYVYEARQESLDRRVAIKMIRCDRLGKNRLALEALLSEAKALARASAHPNVAQIHDIVRDAHGRSCIVMEYLEGLTVDVMMRHRHEFTLKESVRIARDVARAVAYTHAKGIVHRDIKPANVMLRSDGLVKLLDFGVARPVDQLRDSEEIAGTLLFMAPEMARGETSGDFASDIFSLSVLLFAMATKRLPFVKPMDYDLVGPPRALNTEIPERLESTLLRGLDPEPRRRIATAEKLADELDLFLDQYNSADTLLLCVEDSAEEACLPNFAGIERVKLSEALGISVDPAMFAQVGETEYQPLGGPRAAHPSL